MNWHTIPPEETLKQINSQMNGLNDDEVKKRLEEYGKNELTAKKKISPLVIFVRQFLDVMILVLIIAAIISVIIGDISDTIVILIIVILNAVIGFIQEYRAEKAIEALKKDATIKDNRGKFL